MPHKKKSKISYLLLSLLSISLFTFSIIKLVPFLGTAVRGAEGDPVLVDLMMDKYIISTEESSDSITVYARIQAVSPKEIISASLSIVPDIECEGLDCSSNALYQTANFNLMTEGCTPQDLPDGFVLDGIADCGGSTDGIYSATFEFGQYSPIGDWKICHIDINDEEGATSFNPTINNVDLTVTTEAGERNISFTNEATTEDTQAPVIKDYVFDKESIDTTNNAETLTMYARFSDNLTGVSNEFPPRIQFMPENDPGFAYPEVVEFEFTLMESGCDSLPTGLDVEGLVGCGDNMDGIYEASVEIPRYSSGGLWNVVGVWNLLDLMRNSFDENGLEASFNNTSTVYDTDAPIINSISISPSSFETVDGPQIVTIEMQIEDDLAGVDLEGVSLANGIRSVTSIFDAYWNETTQLTAGTLTNGTFTMEVIFPQGATKGFWVVGPIDVTDTLGRIRRYTTTELSLTFPELPLYLLNQGTTEQVELQADWILEDWPYYQEDKIVWPDISVRFEEGTIITRAEGGVFAFHRMLATKYDLSTTTSVGSLLDGVNSDYQADLLDCDPAEGCTPTVVDNTALVGTPLHIIKMGIPGLKLTFSKPVTIIVGMDEKYLGSTFIIQTFDDGLNRWVEHGSCTVAIIEPPSTDHGGDAFGLIKPVAYPGCSFTTDHASFFSTNVLGLETDETEEKQAGVPKTGLGGIENSVLAKYFKWLR